jgi:hypothetical protein
MIKLIVRKGALNAIEDKAIIHLSVTAQKPERQL